MILEGTPQVLDFNPFEVRTPADASAQLGQEFQVADGRAFRYAKVGASNVSKGKLQVGPAPKTNHHNRAVASAVAIDGTSVTLGLGATAAVADEYAEGYLAVNDVDGEGQVYKIGAHPAASSSANLALTLKDPVKTALTTSSEASLVHNTYNGIVEAASATRNPAGVPLVSVSAGDYCWVQIRGIAALLAGAAIDLGATVVSDGSVAGAVAAASDTAATEVDQIKVGRAVVAGVDTEYRPVYLTIV